MDGRYNILSINLVMEQKTLHESAVIKQQLKDEHIDHATIEFETEKEESET